MRNEVGRKLFSLRNRHPYKKMVLFLCCSYIKIGRNWIFIESTQKSLLYLNRLKRHTSCSEHVPGIILKGLGHEMNIFLMSLKLNQYFLYMHNWFIRF